MVQPAGHENDEGDNEGHDPCPDVSESSSSEVGVSHRFTCQYSRPLPMMVQRTAYAALCSI